MMQRVLPSACALGAALALLPAAGASAHPVWRDVSASFRNSTDQPVTLGYYDDGRYRRLTLEPHESVDDLTQNDSGMVVSLEDCGPARIRVGNPGIGAPGVTLTADSGGGNDQTSLDVGERRILRFQGVTIAALRQPDSASAKNFDIDVRGCRADAADTMTPVAERSPNPVGARYVRATVRNATAQSVDIGYVDADDRWRALTVAPGATTPSFGTNETQLTLVLSDCGPARLRFTNQVILAPSVALFGERWTLSGRELDVDESTTFTHDGVAIQVTRGDDSAASKQFSVDLQSC
jgi:hypothetical protein